MDVQKFYSLQEAYDQVHQLDEVSDRKVRAVRDAREKQWNKQFGKNRVQDPTDDMVDKVDKLIDQRNKRTGSKVKKTTMGQLRDKLRREEVSVYDIILSHLLDEGYASTEEAADKIILNMSESWFEEIVEARRSEKEGKGSPESPLSYPGRKIQKERGERGGIHQYSGSQEYGGAEAERGRKKSDPHSQHRRLERLRNYPEQPGKYSKMQSKKRDLGSRFD